MTSYRQPTGAGPLIQWQQQKLAIPAAALLAAEKQRAGQWQAAEGIYQAMLRVLPAAAELHNNLGVIRLLANRPAEALTSFERALSLKPEYANAHFNRGCALRSLGRRPEALLSFQQAVKYQPGHIQALNNSGALLQAMRQYDQALATYKMSLAVNPVNPDAWNNCGIIHLQAGRLPEAEAHFAKAVEQNPDFAAAWFHLAGMRCYAATAYPDAAILQERLKKTGWPEETLEYFHFALGKIHDDRGQYAAAFSHYQTANQLRRRQAVYHRETAEAQTAAVLGQSHQPPAAPCAATPVQPLFIVGMPRSGTTLINQILSHHPAIGSAGEMATL
ncbi:MAG TPA: tetratricopeptide repeat protein, partial [Verrucomicrobiae bacterium]